MKFVIQRVLEGSVEVDHQVIGAIKKGLVVLVGISDTDTEAIADKMVQKLIQLRIFEDENDKTNLSLKDVNGELLVISQFTLYSDCRKGNRPSFVKAGKPDVAQGLYEYILSKCAEGGQKVEKGEFGAHMKVRLINDGPFTIVLDSDEIIK